MLVLSRADLEQVLRPDTLVAALETAFRRYAGGLCRITTRTVIPADDGGVLLLMPAAWRAGGGEATPALGTKLVTVYPGNAARGHPTLYGSYVLMNGQTGQPLAFLEATFLTGIRTGATSALAAQYLARPDARVLACFGAGVQAGFQLRCLAAVLPIDRVLVVGRDPDRARAFCRAMRDRLGLAVDVASDAAKAVGEADVVTCATTSATPVVSGANLRPGTHVDAVGAFRSTDREVDTDAVRRSLVVVDTYEGALEEAGDLLIPLAAGAIGREHITAELAELVTGSRPGRTAGEAITLFKSVGFALEDLAAARLAVEKARAQGVGTEIAL